VTLKRVPPATGCASLKRESHGLVCDLLVNQAEPTERKECQADLGSKFIALTLNCTCDGLSVELIFQR
jgi:hypothetical protein